MDTETIELATKRIGEVRHGHAGVSTTGHQTRTYATWLMMIQQCETPGASGWALHGGRGVKVCPRWRTRFENFLEDMGPRPDGMSIRRVNPLGDYEPDNCVWAPSNHVRPEGVYRTNRKRRPRAARLRKAMKSNSERACRIECGFCDFEVAEKSPQLAGNEIVWHFWVDHSEEMEAGFREWESAVKAIVAAA